MKGQVPDLILLFLMMGIIAVSIVIGGYVTLELQDTTLNDTTGNKSLVDGYNAMVLLGNEGYLLLFFLSLIGIIVIGYFVEAKPIFYIVLILSFFVGMLVIPIIANVYLDMAASSELVAVANEMELMNAIINSYPTIFAIGVMILGIVMYIRRDSGGGPGYSGY